MYSTDAAWALREDVLDALQCLGHRLAGNVALRHLVHVGAQHRVVAEFFLGGLVERQRAQGRGDLV